MIKSNGKNKVRVAVFISGKGSNLKSLIKFSLKKNSKFSISLIVSNNSKALGLKYAKLFDIKKKIINYKSKIKNTKLLDILIDSNLCIQESH